MRNAEQKISDLQLRTKQFALRVIRLYASLERSGGADVVGKQLVRCGTSVGAQYREATRARSVAEFISKMESASQELAETEYWMELLVESGIVKPERMADLLKETNELTAIFVASVNTAKRGRRTKEM
jgi:four helix bundle protein